LTRCDAPNDSEWAPCSQQGNPSTLQAGSFCTCTDPAKTTIAFKDAPTLSDHASLPQRTGEEIQFFAGHVPTTPPGGPTGGSSNGGNGGGGGTTSGGTGANGSPSETGAGSSPTGGGNNANNNGGGGGGGGGLDSAAKIGIGVGVGLGLVLLLGILGFVLYRRRQRRSSVAGAAATTEPREDVKPAAQRISAVSAYTPTVSEADGQAVSEADSKEVKPRPGSSGPRGGAAEMEGRAAAPWNVRSELEGQPGPTSLAEQLGEGALVSDAHGAWHVRRSGELSPVPELPGTEAAGVAGQGGGVQVPGARWKIKTGPTAPPGST